MMHIIKFESLSNLFLGRIKTNTTMLMVVKYSGGCFKIFASSASTMKD
jgi:hypothetical protein